MRGQIKENHVMPSICFQNVITLVASADAQEFVAEVSDQAQPPAEGRDVLIQHVAREGLVGLYLADPLVPTPHSGRNLRLAQ
jgi:hypothetical protein